MTKYTIQNTDGLNVTIEVAENALNLCKSENMTELGVVGCVLGVTEALGNDYTVLTPEFSEFSVLDVSSLVTLVGVVKHTEDSTDLVIKTAVDCDTTYIRSGADVVPISSVVELLKSKGLITDAVHGNDK